MRSRLLTAAVLAVLVPAVAGCGGASRPGAADKAGGSTAPVVLRAAVAFDPNQPDARDVEYFAAQVAKLSSGRLRVKLVFDVGGLSDPNAEARAAGLVRNGTYDLGWIGARAWDELGVKSFQALQAPFLITSYPLLEKVVTSPLAGEMLAGLRSRQMVGLALVPGLLRHPAGLRRPLMSLSDFAGARFRDIPSRATDALLTALGAVPSHVGNNDFEKAAAEGRIDGGEWSLANAPLGGIVTANITFFGKALTLFAGKRSFSGLSAEQRDILRRAAARTVAHAADHPVRDALAFESVLARRFCKTPGRVVLASNAQLLELERAARPVYADLQRDPETSRLIAAIRTLGASLPPPLPIRVPTACTRPKQPAVAPGKSLGPLDGTYHWRLTEAAARAFGPPATNPENDHYPAVNAAVLRDGVVTIVSSPAADAWHLHGRGKPTRIQLSGERVSDDLQVHARRRRYVAPEGRPADRPRRRVGLGRCSLAPGRASHRHRLTDLLRTRAGEAELGDDPCSTARRVLEKERSSQRFDTIGQPSQAGATGGVGTTDTVIGNLDADDTGVRAEHDRDRGGTRVLGDVGERLGADEEDSRLDLLG